MATAAGSGGAQGVLGVNGLGLNGLGVNYLGLNCLGVNYLGLNCLGVNYLGLNCLGLNCLGVNYLGLNWCAVPDGVGVVTGDSVGAGDGCTFLQPASRRLTPGPRINQKFFQNFLTTYMVKVALLPDFLLPSRHEET